MISQNLSDQIDEITETFVAIEQLLAGIVVEVPNLPLSYKRTESGKVRLLYNGKPVQECKIAERVEAAFHLHNFMIAWNEARMALEEKATQAIRLVKEEYARIKDTIS